MKARHIIGTALIALIMGYAGAYLAIPKNISEKQETKKETAYERVLRTGILRCGYAVWPPIVLQKDPNTGEISGIMKDIIEEAAKNLSIKVEWTQEAGWAGWPEDLENQRFDLFCAGSWRNGAKGRVARYTIPVFYSPTYAYVRADDTRFDQGLDILNDPQYKISGQDGEFSERVAVKDFPKSTYVGIPATGDISSIFLNVANGKADIVFNVPDIAADFIKSNPSKLKRLSDKPYTTSSTAFGMNIDEVNLQQMLDSSLIELIESGTVDKILKKYNAPRDQLLRTAPPYQTAE